VLVALALASAGSISGACSEEGRDPIFDGAERTCTQRRTDCPHTEFQISCEGLADALAGSCTEEQRLAKADEIVRCMESEELSCRDAEACFHQAEELPCYFDL